VSEELLKWFDGHPTVEQGGGYEDLKAWGYTRSVIRAAAPGFKLTIDQLKPLAAPVIIFVQPLGYEHFAVLRGIGRGRVFRADPACGNLRMSIGRFVSE
jgi:ABC-type bacteriocin/lantibiotic exporter with double-glycine peptidase domain